MAALNGQSITVMPRIAPDEILAADVRRFVDEVGGTAAAASRLGVEKTMLWRFARSGCAIRKNRVKLRAALDALQNATKNGNATSNAVQAGGAGVRLSASTLNELRSTLTNMIVLIDAYAAMG
ncbi:hypothetical protein [Paraburkholderia tropica]|uniref:hypothetical protein n=1 Tax=Paraburkholderia tropica TaxID=92647 RepID=UPI001590D477|nr:hypothetical protein [Paraburkholderia tropica]